MHGSCQGGFLASHGHGASRSGHNILGFLLTVAPLWGALLVGVLVVGTLCGGFAFDGGDGYSGGGWDLGGSGASDGGWQTGQVVHDSDGHTGLVRRDGDFVYIDRDDGTTDTVYDARPGEPFTSSSGHRYW